MMSSEGEKSQELHLLNDSNYMSWCNSILDALKVIDLILLSVVDAINCPLSFNWNYFSDEEGKCMQYNAQATCILTKAFSSDLEDSICKEYGFLEDAHLQWKVLKENFATSTTKQDSADSLSLTKPVRLVSHTDQTYVTEKIASEERKSKCHRPSGESTSD
jgi:hypothetical protein